MSATSEYYKDKIAVVIGAASGVGLALAETMLFYRAKKVVLADVNDENLKREKARLDAAYPGRTLSLHCDVTNEGEVQAMIRGAAEFGGRIDILFNNAGAGLGGARCDRRRRQWRDRPRHGEGARPVRLRRFDLGPQSGEEPRRARRAP